MRKFVCTALILFNLFTLYAQTGRVRWQKIGLSEPQTITTTLYTLDMREIPAGAYVPAGIYLQKKDLAVTLPDTIAYPVNPIDSVPVTVYCNMSAQDVADLTAQMETNLLNKRGPDALDSIEAVTKRIRRLDTLGLLFVPSHEIQFVESTATYEEWLTSVFSGAQSVTDSIENLSRAIPAFYPLGDGPVVAYMEPDSIYYQIRRGELAGECGHYTAFMTKIADRFADTWGVPIEITGGGDSAATHGGDALEHTWVGFVNQYGQIWCVADPTRGGIVRNVEGGNSLSQEDLMVLLHDPQQAQNVVLEPVSVSLEQWSGCIWSILFRETTNLEKYVTPSGLEIVKGNWYTYGDKFSVAASMNVAYWRAKNYPLNVIENIYCEIKSGLLHTQDNGLATKVSMRYHIPVTF